MPTYYRENRTISPVQLPLQPFDCDTYHLPRQMVPFIIGALQSIAYRERYIADNNFAGLEAIRGTQYMLMKPCNDGWQQLYALIDTIYNGTVYTNAGTIEEPILSPSIPPSPETPEISMSEAFSRIEGLIAQGVLGESADSPYPTADSILPVLIEIRDATAGMSEEEIADLLSLLAQIAAAL